MSLDLTIANPINSATQPVADQNDNASALSLASQQVTISGTDLVNSTFPFIISGKTTASGYTNGTTWGRLIRLQDSGTSNAFYDIGIDQQGNLYVNSGSSTETKHILKLTPGGVLTLAQNLA